MHTQTEWKFHHPLMSYEHLGFLPFFLDPDDKRSAIEQIRDEYISGWPRYDGFELLIDNSLRSKDRGSPEDPADPDLTCLASTEINGETVCFYQFSWVAVIRADRTFEVARID